MKFDARPLRVQLPCSSITVIDAAEHDALVQAHQYWQAVAWREKAKLGLAGRCEECSANPSEPLCQNESQDPDLSRMFDVRVLPILRRQVEARLQEIASAEEAVAKAIGEG